VKTAYLYSCFISEITGNIHEIKSCLVPDRRNDANSGSCSESENEIESGRFNAKNNFSEESRLQNSLFSGVQVIRKSGNVLEGMFFGSRATGKAASQRSLVLANGGLPDLPAETISVILFK
jgi:hypothetical protein